MLNYVKNFTIAPLQERVFVVPDLKYNMPDFNIIGKTKEKISHDENRLEKMMREVQKLWEDTGLDPKDQSYLVEKTMRFEMAQENIDKIFSLFKEHVSDYKRLCSELEKSESSE